MVKGGYNLVFEKAGKLRVDSYEHEDEPGEDEVLINVNSCGICGSDLHWYAEGKLGPFYMNGEVIPGHEASGTITKVGSKVTDLKVGDRVCIEPCGPCWVCDLCRTGSNNLCFTADNFSCGFGRTGFYRTSNPWPALLCHKLPDNMTLEEGAVVEPVACAVWGLIRTKLQGNEKILVTGSGPIGLLCLQVAKAFGASKICVTDINEKRLALATELGADYIYKVDPKLSPQQAADQIVALMNGPPDVCIECSGVGSAINTGIYCVRRGGKVTLMGLGSHGVNADLSTASLREVDLIAVARYNNTFKTAIDLISSGKVNVKKFISHRFSITEAQKAFDTLLKGEGVKVLLGMK